MTKVLSYIRRKTKGMTPSQRFMWAERAIFNPLRIESIKYVNGEIIDVGNEIDTIGEAILAKDEKSKG